jgi:hypothetical protein
MPLHEPVVGKLATVTHPIVGGKPGEVVVHVRDTTETSMAYAHTDAPVQTPVIVIGNPRNLTEAGWQPGLDRRQLGDHPFPPRLIGYWSGRTGKREMARSDDHGRSRVKTMSRAPR